MRPRDRLAIPPELLEAARGSDQAALVALLEAAQPHVQRYARSACRSSSDAEDAAQDALWLIYRRVGKLHVLGSFAGWAFAIVRRECLRLARLASGRAELREDDRLGRRTSTMTDLDLRLDLAAAIEALPAHYREVLLLRDVQGMTIKELSDHLGLTTEGAKARLHRARVMTRESLKG